MQFLSAEKLRSFQSFASFLQSRGLAPASFMIGSDGVDNLYLASGTQIIFADDQDITALSGNVDTIMANTKLFSSAATSTLDYLDLRFGNKIYYRFK